MLNECIGLFASVDIQMEQWKWWVEACGYPFSPEESLRTRSSVAKWGGPPATLYLSRACLLRT